MQEEWRVIPEFPDYEISNTGRVKSANDYLCHDDGGNEVPKLMSPFKSSSGKIMVHLVNIERYTNIDIASYVCTIFNAPKPNPKLRVLHKDKDKSNLVYTNLYWGTFKEYCTMYGIKPGRPVGLKKARTSIETIKAIQARYAEGVRQVDIAKEFGMTQPNVSIILKKVLR